MKLPYGFRCLVVLIVVMSLTTTVTAHEEDLPTCGDCYCIAPANGTCPTEDKPQTDFSSDLIAFYRSLEYTNPFTLDCDPYADESCATAPPQDDAGADSVCAIRYAIEVVGVCPLAYSLSTRSSREAVESDPFLVLTHTGPCGACSSLQDLALYMEKPSIAQDAAICGVKTLVNVTDAVECFQELGFSPTCAQMYAYDSKNSIPNCAAICLPFSQEMLPSNGPPPECELATCLQCNEDVSGPTFSRVAVRNRRSSGLLGGILRPCDQIESITHEAPCNLNATPTEMPQFEPTDMPAPTDIPQGEPTDMPTPEPPTTSASNKVDFWKEIVLAMVLLLCV